MEETLVMVHSPKEYTQSQFSDGVEKTTSQSSSWRHPFRRNSGSSTSSQRSKKRDEVVVFIRSTEEVCLKDRAEVQVQAEKTPPLSTVDLPRYPWTGEKEVYVPTQFGGKHDSSSKRCKCCEWAATIELDSISPGFRFRRVAGNVKQLFVFDKPLGEQPYSTQESAAMA